jgi:predicted transcriptional regulator
MGSMIAKLRELLERAKTWPEGAQQELVQLGAEIEGELQAGDYQATPEELAAIDEALEQIARGEVATEAEVEAAFRTFRRP